MKVNLKSNVVNQCQSETRFALKISSNHAVNCLDRAHRQVPIVRSQQPRELKLCTKARTHLAHKVDTIR